MSAVPDEGACQLEQAQIVRWLLVVAHQYCPALGQPGQGAFHHPTPGPASFLARLVQLLLSNAADMGTVSECGNGTVACGIVIPFVQAQVLGCFLSKRRTFRRGFGAGHDYTLQSPLQQLRVVDVGSGHHHAQGSAFRVDQHALLAPRFTPVRGVGSNGAPPKRALPMEQSADCHSQFTPPNSWHSSIRTAQMPSSAPHPTQRWKVRWIVLSSPNSSGKWFHWQPLRIRKTIPSSIFRWSTRLRPFDLGGSNSSITGSIRSQRSSGTSQIVGNGFPSSTTHLHPPLGTTLATTVTL